jgi:hypothetical protein
MPVLNSFAPEKRGPMLFGKRCSSMVIHRENMLYRGSEIAVRRVPDVRIAKTEAAPLERTLTSRYRQATPSSRSLQTVFGYALTRSALLFQLLQPRADAGDNAVPVAKGRLPE